MNHKRLLAWLLILALLPIWGACSANPQRYEASYLDLFDTVTTVVGYADSEDAFRQTVDAMYEELRLYHQLFDIYNTYPGMNNLKTVNDQAGASPVTVDHRILELLHFCQEMERATDGLVNVGMGSVLSLWHDARTRGLEDPGDADLPDQTMLLDAAQHTDLSAMVLDAGSSTVYLTDPQMRLDVGAVAKGYAVEQVCKAMPEGYLVSVGGNVCATGPKPDGSGWVVGLQKPDGSGYLHTVETRQSAVVTSGDYQRYYIVDDVRYHHIIDPDTLMPADKWQAVSVLCDNSGVADILSTALFLLDQASGQALLDAFDAEALWLDSENNLYYSPGFSAYMKS